MNKKWFKTINAIIVFLAVGICYADISNADCMASCKGKKQGNTSFGQSCAGNNEEGFCFSCSASCKFSSNKVSCPEGGKVNCPTGTLSNTVERCFSDRRSCDAALSKSKSSGLCQAGEDPSGPGICDLCIDDKCPTNREIDIKDTRPQF